MRRSADVVIGSAFGDEGKGLITDVLAWTHPGDTLVVRFNGGAQAGHTVVTPAGERHVFSHFGSGTLAGAATFLSRFFVVHPMLFHRERERLAGLGVSPRVFVDPRCAVTTPFDMAVNTALERHRAGHRHGSCGIGFGETVGRTEEGPYALTVADLATADARRKLRLIRDRWLPHRLARQALALSEQERSALLSDALLERFLQDCTRMLEEVIVCDERLLRSAPHVVFEGAQGLLLDQELGHFPHVTRSHTGLPNVAALADAAGFTALEVYYVLRPYLTRHGAGPLPGELAGPPWPGILDRTNVANPWQGALRFALLDIDRLAATIERDARRTRHAGSLRLSRRIAVTCLDQVGGAVRALAGRTHRAFGPMQFVRRCMDAVAAEQALISRGPTRCTCQRVAGSSVSAIRVPAAPGLVYKRPGNFPGQSPPETAGGSSAAQ